MRPLRIEILRRRFVRCRRCGLRFVPEGAVKACAACGGKDLRRGLEPFHLGALLLVLAIGSATVELGRAARAPAAPETALVQARRLVVAVEAGPARGRKITLRRGDVVEVKDRDGSTLVVEDARGNQVRVTSKHVQLR